ncbi:MAG: hypothetical protein AAGL23_01775 [Pseudomonadota bacterium]
MSDNATEPDEDERIRLWREERARVAEAEKQERLEQKAAERQAEKIEQDRLRDEALKDLLPTDDQIRQTDLRLSQYHQRRRRSFLRQLLVMVVLPILAFALYLLFVAVPLYESRAVIAITKPATEEEGNIGGLLGSLQGPSNLQEMFMAHEFVGSDALVAFLEEEAGLISELSSPKMDPLRRIYEFDHLPITVTRQFRAFVESSANIQSGLLTVHVRLPDPQQSVDMSRLILKRTEEQINTLSNDVFAKRVQLAEQVVAEAQSDLQDAQLDVVDLQIKSGEANPNIRIENIYLTIRQLTAEMQEITSEIERARIAGGISGRNQEERLIEMRVGLLDRIEAQRALLVTEPQGGGMSLNNLLTQYELAALNVTIAEQGLTSALEGLSNARQSAALGQSIFQVVVPPTVAARPSFPNTPAALFIATIVALSVFGLARMIFPTRTQF